MGNSPKFIISRLTEAYTVFRKVNNLPSNKNTITKFFQFLNGSDVLKEESLEDEKVANRIKWLTGPHGEVLYKAWKIRNGEKY